MAKDNEKTRQDQVKELIALGTHTKKSIAETLEIPVNSVSSQLTYLRWKGNNIITNPETKILSFVSDEELAAHNDAIKAAKAAKASASSTKTPQERANALVITIKRQETALANAIKKVDQIEKDLAEEPDDAELQDLLEEAKANVVIIKSKIKRNKALAETLPEPNAGAAAVEGSSNIDESDENETPDDDDLD